MLLGWGIKGEVGLPATLRKICFAALLTCTGLSAAAAEMPVSGTKNFVPGGEAPAYFTNENGAVSAATAEDSPADDGVDQVSRSSPPELGMGRSANTMSRRHGKLAASRRFGKHIAGNPRIGKRSTHIGGGKTTKTAAAGAPSRPIRTAGPPRTKTASPAKPSKTNIRHASVKSSARRG